MPYIYVYLYSICTLDIHLLICVYIYIYIWYFQRFYMSKNIDIDTVDSKIYMRQTIQKGIMDRYINIYIQNKNVYIHIEVSTWWI